VSPYFLAYLPFKPARKFALSLPSGVLGGWFLSGMGRVVAKKSNTVVILSVIVGVVAATAIPKVPREADMMASFPEDSEPRSSERLLRRGFGGSQLVTVSFLAQDIREPVILGQMALLEKRLRVLPHVHFPQSAVNLVTMLNRLINDQPGLPNTILGVSNLWFLLERQASAEMMVASDFKEGIVQARIGESHPAVVRRVLEHIERVLEETVKTDLVTVSISAQPEHLLLTESLKRSFLISNSIPGLILTLKRNWPKRSCRFYPLSRSLTLPNGRNYLSGLPPIFKVRRRTLEWTRNMILPMWPGGSPN
jgi:predicted RND superfamily exporter protein